MNSRNPKITALEFNECITRQDIVGLSALMSEDHLFVDREGKSEKSRDRMTRGWSEFFRMFPDYKNTFVRVESRGELVIMIGYAYWNETDAHDPAIWVAKITDDLVAEWRIYSDNAENRRRFGID